MKIAAITKFKQGDLYQAIQRVGWTQSDLAREVGVASGTIGQVMNMRVRPSEKLATKIQAALATQGEIIDVLAVWPEGFALRGDTTGAHIQYADVKTEALFEYARRGVLSLVEDNDDDQMQKRLELLPAALDSLDSEDRALIRARFESEKSFRRVGEEKGLTPEAVRQRERVVLNKLKRRMRVLTVTEAEE